MIWAYTLGSVIVVSLISLIGVITLAWGEHKLRKVLFVLVALAAGALFGDVLIHLIPEIFETAPNTLFASLGIMAGVLVFFVLEKFLHWHHHHHVSEEHEHDHPVSPLGQISLVSDGLHNFLDGLIIGAAFLASPTIGFATTLAVILHEIPQEIGDFSVLLHAGFSKARAIFFNFLSAVLAVLGAIVALVIGSTSEDITLFILPIAAGGFLYLAGSDLVPELHKITNPKKSLLQFTALIIGVLLMAALMFLE